MKQILLTLMIAVFSSTLSFADEGKYVEHHYKTGETLWFISLLYYGKGGDYQKIVDANHLPSTEGLKDGQVLHIPGTKWKPGTSEFEAHYKEKWEKHQARLKQVQSESASLAKIKDGAVKKEEPVAKKAEPVVKKESTVAKKGTAHKEEAHKSGTPAMIVNMAPKKHVVENSVQLSENNSEPASVLVVPIPASPLIPSSPSSGTHAPGENFGERSAGEGATH